MNAGAARASVARAGARFSGRGAGAVPQWDAAPRRGEQGRNEPGANRMRRMFPLHPLLGLVGKPLPSHRRALACAPRVLPRTVVAPAVAARDVAHGLGALTGTVLSAGSISMASASSTAVPIMVATDTRNGAIRRVPAIGTSQAKTSLLSAMYLTV